MCAMKKYFCLALAGMLLVGCAGYQPKTQLGKYVIAWWAKPSTQEGVHYVTQAATNFAINAGLAALQQYAGGGPINYQTIALQGGISTLYQQAANIRQLQGTHQVLDPAATAMLLEQGGTPEEISRKLAAALVANTQALISRANIPPDQAAEINAAALDRAALILSTATEVSK
jgi:hypothetical protein